MDGFILENTIQMDDLGVKLLQETSILLPNVTMEIAWENDLEMLDVPNSCIAAPHKQYPIRSATNCSWSQVPTACLPGKSSKRNGSFEPITGWF